MASSVSRRIETSIISFMKKNYETSLIHFFPALDKTSKTRWPNARVGERIKNFIAYQESIIFAIATNNMFVNCSFGEISFAQAVYKYGRTSIVHEGELDHRLRINSAGNTKIGAVWDLDSGFVFGLIISVIIAPENKNEKLEKDVPLRLFGREFNVSQLWGAQDEIEGLIRNVWNQSDMKFR